MDEAMVAGREPVLSAFRQASYLGVDIALLDADEAACRIAALPEGAPYVYVVTPNAAHFTRLDMLEDERFRDAYAHAWMRLLDGQVPRALARLLFGLDLPHAAGSDLTLKLLEGHIRPDDAITIIGGNAELVSRLERKFGLTRVAHLNPSMGFIQRPEEVEGCVDFILKHPARYVFFAVGAPQSEYLARAVDIRGEAIGCGLCIGSSLNFATGMVKRAPAFFRRTGLEWAYRLAQNPVGHARRVFVDSLPVIWIAFKARFIARSVAAGTHRKGDA